MRLDTIFAFLASLGFGLLLTVGREWLFRVGDKFDSYLTGKNVKQERPKAALRLMRIVGILCFVCAVLIVVIYFVELIE